MRNGERRIVLVTINAKWIHPSLALRLLKANLGELEANCEILEFALRQPLEEKIEAILSARPGILALSVSIWNHKATLELLEALGKEWASKSGGEKPVVVFGGPEVSWLPVEAEIFRHADFVIRGEGEESFASLCRRLFNGLETKDFFINHGETTVDVNNIYPAYRLYTDEDLKQKLVYVEASRGCPFACEFCHGAIGARGLKAVREFPLEPFLADMADLIKRGGRTFKFLDRTFNLNMERTKRIMEFFLARIEAEENRASLAQGLCVHFEMVPSRFPGDLKELIRRFPPGTLRLELGIQSLNPETRNLVRLPGAAGNPEGTPLEELKTLEFLRRETNAIVHVDLIAGLPGEDFDSFAAGFDRLWQAVSGNTRSCPGDTPAQPFFEIQLGILKCLPGTAIVRHREACDMRYSAEAPYEVIETGALSAAGLERIKNFARFWELLVNRKPFPDLIQRFLPPGEKVFDKFMDISDRLLEKFGRNWGIDRNELKLYLESLLSSNS
jgi:radical SAM superfamily enzyme YgiQ (UPF0313 family)